MKHRTSTIYMLAALAAAGWSLPALARDPAAEAEILRIEKDLVAAQTVPEMLRPFDRQIVLYDIMPPEIDGIAALKGTLEKQHSVAKKYTIDFVSIHVEADGELGFAYSVQHIKIPGGAPKAEFVFRQTDCYHKVDGHWLIVSQHVSIPIDFASGKAVYE